MNDLNNKQLECSSLNDNKNDDDDRSSKLPSASTIETSSNLFIDHTFNIQRSSQYNQLQQSSSSSTSTTPIITRSKRKRVRTSFKHQQLRTMRAHFQMNQNPDSKDLKELSERTGLQKRVLQVWFQNSRAKQRKNGGNCGNNNNFITTTTTTSSTLSLSGSSSCSIKNKNKENKQYHDHDDDGNESQNLDDDDEDNFDIDDDDEEGEEEEEEEDDEEDEEGENTFDAIHNPQDDQNRKNNLLIQNQFHQQQNYQNQFHRQQQEFYCF
jgi:hypothetical protein